MAYLNDILGLLNLRENFGLGQQQLAQRAHEFELEFGLSKDEAMHAAQQWQQQFGEQQNRRRFEQQQQEKSFAQQQGQQNYLNQSRDFAQGTELRQNQGNDLLKLFAANPKGVGMDQMSALYQRFGLPAFNSRPGTLYRSSG